MQISREKDGVYRGRSRDGCRILLCLLHLLTLVEALRPSSPVSIMHVLTSQKSRQQRCPFFMLDSLRVNIRMRCHLPVLLFRRIILDHLVHLLAGHRCWERPPCQRCRRAELRYLPP